MPERILSQTNIHYIRKRRRGEDLSEGFHERKPIPAVFSSFQGMTAGGESTGLFNPQKRRGMRLSVFRQFYFSSSAGAVSPAGGSGFSPV